MLRKIRGFLSIVQADFARHWREEVSLSRNIQELLLSQGAWAILNYRWGQFLHQPVVDHSGTLVSKLVRAALRPAKVAYLIQSKLIEMNTGISLPANARIGKGFYIGHFGEIILHPEVVAGDNLSIGQGVTIGVRGLGKSGAPVIGSNVYIGVGAKILGPITIGDNAAIGANAVVVKNVPAFTTAVGVPAKILHNRKSESFSFLSPDNSTNPKKEGGALEK